MFIVKFPAIALFISFEEFSDMVDTALNELQLMMNVNKNIKDIIEKKEEE